jgi:hypothetical protein
MCKRLTVRSHVVLGIFLATLLAAPAALRAQSSPKEQVFGGYSYLRFDSTQIGFGSVSNMNGWNFSPAYNFTKHFGIAVEAGGHYGNHQRIYSFMAGPQLLFPHGNGIVFAHLLFGKAEDKVSLGYPDSNNRRAFALGLGYDHNFSPRVAFRVVQVDLLNTQLFGTSQNNLRVSTGVVFHWGERKK